MEFHQSQKCRPRPTRNYTTLAQAYYAENFRLNPIGATQVGVHDYDDKIGDFSATGIAAELKLDHTYLDQLATIDRSSLSPSVALDATLLEYALRDDLLLNETLEQWRHNPDTYTQAASAAIFTVMSKDYAPLDKRMAFAIARERLIPAMLLEGEKNTTTVDAVTQRISAEDALGRRGLLQNVGSGSVRIGTRSGAASGPKEC